MGNRYFRSFFIFLRKVKLQIIFCTFSLFFISNGVVPAFAVVSMDSTPGAQNVAKKSVIKSTHLLRFPFIKNHGQINDPQVKYYSQMFSGTVYVTGKNEIIYRFLDAKPQNSDDFSKPGIISILKEELIGSSVNPPQGKGPSQTKVNYFIGNDKSKWRTNIPTYDAVSLGEVYKGINLTLRAYGNNVEKIFAVEPGANPRKIKLKIEGAGLLKISKDGELEVQTNFGVIRFGKPVGYQIKKGKKINVPIDYLIDKAFYGFAAKDYDKSLPLIIDPTIKYSTLLGGTNSDEGLGISLAGDSAYIVGYTSSDDLPATQGTYQGNLDVFVAKFQPDGSAVDFVSYLGGQGNDIGRDLVIGSGGEVFLTGDTDSTDFPVPGGLYTENAGSTDAFVAVLNATGSVLNYSTYLGGSGVDHGFGVSLDSAGPVYVAGDTFSTDFPTTPGAYSETPAGGAEAYVVKFNSDGSSLLYSTYIGGGSDDSAHDVKVDSADQAYIVGSTSSSDFPVAPDPGAVQISIAGGSDAFIARLNASGTALSFSTYLGGSQNDAATSLVLDDSGTVFVTGYTYSGDFPLAESSFQNFLGGENDAFVAVINNSGESLLYSTFLGGDGPDVGRDLDFDNLGNLYVTGETGSTDFPVAGNAFQTSLEGTQDAFLTGFNNDGSALIFSSYLGGDANDVGNDVAVNDSGQIFITGRTNSSNFPTTTGAFQPDNAGAVDAFIVNIDGLATDSISGKVTAFGSGDPVEGVEVEVYNETVSYFDSNFSDTTGFYQILDLPSGCYDVQAYPPSSSDFQISSRRRVSLSAGEIGPTVDFELDPKI